MRAGQDAGSGDTGGGIDGNGYRSETDDYSRRGNHSVNGRTATENKFRRR